MMRRGGMDNDEIELIHIDLVTKGRQTLVFAPSFV